jgi:Zn-dependent protease
MNVGLVAPFLLLLLLLALRSTVTPRASLVVKAPAAKVFDMIDLHDGKVNIWTRTTVTSDLIDPARQIFRMSYVTSLSNGLQQKSQADFRVHERRPPNYLELRREGLDGKSHKNELMKIIYEVEELPQGSRLSLAYHWGSRPLMAQLLARTDLWGGIYRLKGLAEIGKPDERTHMLISIAVAVVTAGFSIVAFGILLSFKLGPLLGWIVAVMAVIALAIHEFGHLIAFRMIGQPWGKLVFLPFLGAIAVPRLAYQTQAQAVFSALMGPGFSALFAIAIATLLSFGFAIPVGLIGLGAIIVVLNLFNLLPIEPLDGGVALRSVLTKLMGSYARFGLMLIGILMIAGSIYFQLFALFIFGSIYVVVNIRPRTIDYGLEPLSSLQVIFSVTGFGAIIASYIIVWRIFVAHMA